MNVERVTVLNLDNGQVGVVRRSIFESPVFNVGQLVEVDDDQKSYHPDLWKPHTLEEWLDRHPEEDETEDVKVYQSLIVAPVDDDPIFDSLIAPPTEEEEK